MDKRNWIRPVVIDDTDIAFETINWLQFEELCYDLLSASSYHTMTWRQGGGDQGRDIEAKLSMSNALTGVQDENWLIECKHYVGGVNKEDISDKISWAEALRPDHFLLITSGYVTNSTRAWLEMRQPHVSFKIHILEGKELKAKIASHPQVYAKYFLNNPWVKLVGIRRQWLNHNIYPDVESFYQLFQELDFDTLPTTDLGFVLFLLNELEDKMETYCEQENLELPEEKVLIRLLRKHVNHKNPIVTTEELEQRYLSLITPNYSRLKMETDGSDIIIYLVKEKITNAQTIDMMVMRENRRIEVRVSLQE